MSISFVGSNSGSDGATVTPITLTLPAHTTGDVAIIFAVCDYDLSGIQPVMSLTGAAGWTELVQELILGGWEQKTAVFYKRFTSSSEATPSIELDLPQEHSASVHVFRGVDPTTMFDVAYSKGSTTNLINPVNKPALTTVNSNSCIFLLHSFTHDEISICGSPSGYTLGANIPGELHRGQAAAYLLDSGAPGTKAPGTWTHTGALVTQDNRMYSLALRADPTVVTPPTEEEIAAASIAVGGSLDKITDHLDKGLSALIEQYKESTNLKALLSSFVSRAQGLEDVSYDVLVKRSIDNAEGVQLDDIGAVVNQPREGEDDNVYRVRLRARIKVNISEGTVENLIVILNLITGTSIEVIDDGNASASINIRSAAVTNEVALISGQFTQDAKPVGIDIVITWKQQNRNMFSMGISSHLTGATSIGATLLPASNITSKFPSQGVITIGNGLSTQEDIQYSSYSDSGFTVASGTLPTNAHIVDETITLKRDFKGFSNVKLTYPTSQSELSTALGMPAGGYGYSYLWTEVSSSPLVDVLSSEDLVESNPSNINYSVYPRRATVPSIFIEDTGTFAVSDTTVGDTSTIDDICVLWAGIPREGLSVDGNFIGKPGATSGWEIYTDSFTGRTYFNIDDGPDTASSAINVDFEVDKVLVLMGVVDRTNQEIRLYARQGGVTYTGSTGDTTIVDSVINSNSLSIGASATKNAVDCYYLMSSVFKNSNADILNAASLESFVSYVGFEYMEDTYLNGALSSSLTIKTSEQDRADRLIYNPYQFPTQTTLITPNTKVIRYPKGLEYERILGTDVTGYWFTQSPISPSEVFGAPDLTSLGSPSVNFDDALSASSVTFIQNSSAYMAGSPTFGKLNFTTSFMDIWVGKINDTGSGTDPASTDGTLGIVGKVSTGTGSRGRKVTCGADFISCEVTGVDTNGNSTRNIEYISNASGRTFFDNTPIIIASVYDNTGFRLYIWSKGVVYKSSGSVPTPTDTTGVTSFFKVGSQGTHLSAGFTSTLVSTSVDVDVSSFDYTTLSHLATFLRFQ